MAKILLIEDDVDLSSMVSARLEAESHVVECAHGGKVGYDRLVFTKYDLSILHWNLPGMEGVEVLKEYRKSGGNSPGISDSKRRDCRERSWSGLRGRRLSDETL